MSKKICKLKNKQFGKWKTLSLEGSSKDGHRLWSVQHVETGEKRLMPSNSIKKLKHPRKKIKKIVKN